MTCGILEYGFGTYDIEGSWFAFQAESLEAAFANSRKEIRYGDAAHAVDVKAVFE